MASNKFAAIYEELKKRIIQGTYAESGLLPTEAILIDEFSCSRNTVRRAIQKLNEEGFVYSVKGRGVVILETTRMDETYFKFHNFHGLKALNSAREIKKGTKVLQFEEIVVSDMLAKEISFQPGEEAYLVVRLRLLDDRAVMVDTSYFKKSLIPGLSEEIAQGSIYHYIEHDLQIPIAANKTILRIEKATALDHERLDLQDYNCVGVFENMAYTDMGKLFEHTESRYLPENFAIESYKQRKKDE